MSRLIRRTVTGALPPHQLLAALGEGPGIRLLEAGGPDGWGTQPGGGAAGLSLLGLDPEVELSGGVEVLEEARRWLDPGPGRDPLESLLIGSLTYDLGRAFERVPARAEEDVPVPPVALAGFRAVYRYHTSTGSGEVVGSDRAAVARTAERVAAACSASSKSPPLPKGLLGEAAVSPLSDPGFRAAVRRIRGLIAAGDVYQVNLSRRLDWDAVPRGALAGLYARLAERAPAPFGAYLDAGSFALLANSPERFLRVDGTQVETCPIKGTRPRGETPARDAWLAKQLETSAKDRAEHVMIVDLERNDLGRICRTGSVRVERLAALRSFATVHHLVSSVRGELREPLDWQALLAATFPGGSITGAPKIRAMQIIDELEPVRRGPYTGAFGYFDAAGGLDLALAIRTAVAERGRLHLHLGSGFVIVSDPDAELHETRDKGEAFRRCWGASG